MERFGPIPFSLHRLRNYLLCHRAIGVPMRDKNIVPGAGEAAIAGAKTNKTITTSTHILSIPPDGRYNLGGQKEFSGHSVNHFERF